MSDKKRQVSAKPKPEHVVRCGEVVVTILKRQANSGLLYRTFLITREWRSMTTQRDSHATSFFESNEEDLVESIRNAAAYVRDKTNCIQRTGLWNGRPWVDTPLHGLARAIAVYVVSDSSFTACVR